MTKQDRRNDVQFEQLSAPAKGAPGNDLSHAASERTRNRVGVGCLAAAALLAIGNVTIALGDGARPVGEPHAGEVSLAEQSIPPSAVQVGYRDWFFDRAL